MFYCFHCSDCSRFLQTVANSIHTARPIRNETRRCELGKTRRNYDAFFWPQEPWWTWRWTWTNNSSVSAPRSPGNSSDNGQNTQFKRLITRLYFFPTKSYCMIRIWRIFLHKPRSWSWWPMPICDEGICSVEVTLPTGARLGGMREVGRGLRHSRLECWSLWVRLPGSFVWQGRLEWN